MAILKSSSGSAGTYHISVGGSGGGGFLSDGSATSITSVSTEHIQGKMITVDLVYTGEDLERLGLSSVPNYFEDTIKKDLIMKLAHSLARENYVEFTKQDNYAEHSITYRARIYATPDDKVRLMRKQGIE